MANNGKGEKRKGEEKGKGEGGKRRVGWGINKKNG